jgi:hypothetical protein
MSMWMLLAGLLGCGGEPAAPVEAPAPLTAPQPTRPARVVAVEAGENTTCLSLEGGQTTCIGAHPLSVETFGGLTVSDAETCQRRGTEQRCFRWGRAVRVQPSPFVEVTRGAGAPCGRDSDGAVWCWSAREEEPELRPVPLPAPAVRVVADGQGSCALLTDHTLHCWDPWQALRRTPEPTPVDGQVRQVEATWLQTCWRTDGSVVCRSGGGRHAVPGMVRPTDLAVGRLHACATQDGVVSCWGDNTWAQVGSGGVQVEVPRPVVGAQGARQLSAGDDHTCALLDQGRVHCWGRDDDDQVSGLAAALR